MENRCVSGDNITTLFLSVFNKFKKYDSDILEKQFQQCEMLFCVFIESNFYYNTQRLSTTFWPILTQFQFNYLVFTEEQWILEAHNILVRFCASVCPKKRPEIGDIHKKCKKSRCQIWVIQYNNRASRSLYLVLSWIFMWHNKGSTSRLLFG